MLLDFADKWARKVIYEEKYSIKTKLFATLYWSIRNPGESLELEISLNYPSRYDLWPILYSLTKNDISLLKSTLPDVRSKYYELCKIKHFRSQDKLKYLVKEGLFFEIVLREKSITPSLFIENLLDELFSIFRRQEKKYLLLLQTFSYAYDIIDINDFQIEINWEDLDLLESSLISYFFLEGYKRNNNVDHLYYHYIAIRNMMDRLRDILEYSDNPSESVLETIFKVGILLHLSGYFGSLSLPNAERLKYIRTELKMSPLRTELRSIIVDTVRVGIKIEQLQIPIIPVKLSTPRELKVPLWGIALTSFLLSLGFILYSINLGSFRFPWKFLGIYCLVTGYLIYKLLRLEKDILMKLERRERL